MMKSRNEPIEFNFNSIEASTQSNQNHIGASSNQWHAIMNHQSNEQKKSIPHQTPYSDNIIHQIPQSNSQASYGEVNKVVLVAEIHQEFNEVEKIKNIDDVGEKIEQDDDLRIEEFNAVDMNEEEFTNLFNTNPYFQIKKQFDTNITNETLLNMMRQNKNDQIPKLNGLFKILELIDDEENQSIADQVQNIIDQNLLRPTVPHKMEQQILYDIDQKLVMNKSGNILNQNVIRRVRVEPNYIVQLPKKKQIKLTFDSITIQAKYTAPIRSFQWIKARDFNFRVLMKLAKRQYAIYTQTLQQVKQLNHFLLCHNFSLDRKRLSIMSIVKRFKQEFQDSLCIQFNQILSRLKIIITQSNLMNQNSTNKLQSNEKSQKIRSSVQQQIMNPVEPFINKNVIDYDASQQSREENFLSQKIIQNFDHEFVNGTITSEFIRQKPTEQVYQDLEEENPEDSMRVYLKTQVPLYLNFLYLKTIKFEKFMEQQLKSSIKIIKLMDEQKIQRKENDKIVNLYEVQSILLNPPDQSQVFKQFSDPDDSLEYEYQSDREEELQVLKELLLDEAQEQQKYYRGRIRLDIVFQHIDDINSAHFVKQWLKMANRKRLLDNLQIKQQSNPLKQDSGFSIVQVTQHKAKPKAKVALEMSVQIEVKKDQGLTLKLFDVSIQQLIGNFGIVGVGSKEVQLNFSTRTIQTLTVHRYGRQIFRQDFKSFQQDQLQVYII